MKKLLSLILAISFIFLSVFCVGAQTSIPKMEQGTINSSDGNTRFEITRIRTADFLELKKYSGVTINAGYEMTNFVYDADKNYLGTSSWLGNGKGFETETLEIMYPAGVYFKLAIRQINQEWLFSSDAGSTGLTFYAAGEELPNEEEIPVDKAAFPNEQVMTLGFWQEGAIFDGKLFVFSHDGTGRVFDLTDKNVISTITLDKKDILSPHANSVCFSSQYYAQGDKYPLLYVNVYNNYKNENDRQEGTCCVYRIVENGNSFTTELVQVIKIGFVEDLNLWKSLSNNGDVRPYGNFVVDPDNNKLYAYVMRDANKTTKFFKFQLPLISQGVYNQAYACRVVTLEPFDIDDSFETQYFNYIQGCDFVYGKIISAEGFNSGSGSEPAFRVIDPESKKVLKTYLPASAGVVNEPEIVAVDPQNGKVYYAASDGVLRLLTFMDEYKVEDVPTDTPTDTPTDKPDEPTDTPIDKPTDTPEEKPEATGTTLVKEADGEWYYYENGIKNNATTLLKYSGKWFYIKNGKWSKKNGFVDYKGKTFFVKSGKWSSETRFEKYNGIWYYLKGGKYDKTLITLGKKNDKWLYVKNGKWSKNKELVKYKGKIFYVNKGFAQLDFSGKAIIGGKKYTVKGGKLV